MSDEYVEICMTREQAHTACLRAYAVAQTLLASGENALITCGPALESVGIQQRKFLHGVVLKQISEKARVGPKGERYTIDLWKEYFRQHLLGFDWVMRKLPGQKRATPHKVWISTESLGIRAYSKFTNEVIDHAIVELGLTLEFTTEEQALIARKPQPETA